MKPVVWHVKFLNLNVSGRVDIRLWHPERSDERFGPSPQFRRFDCNRSGRGTHEICVPWSHRCFFDQGASWRTCLHCCRTKTGCWWRWGVVLLFGCKLNSYVSNISIYLELPVDESCFASNRQHSPSWCLLFGTGATKPSTKSRFWNQNFGVIFNIPENCCFLDTSRWDTRVRDTTETFGRHSTPDKRFDVPAHLCHQFAETSRATGRDWRRSGGDVCREYCAGCQNSHGPGSGFGVGWWG